MEKLLQMHTNPMQRFSFVTISVADAMLRYKLLYLHHADKINLQLEVNSFTLAKFTPSQKKRVTAITFYI